MGADATTAYFRADRHHSRAFWNSFNQGLGPSGCMPTSAGYLHRRMQKPPLDLPRQPATFHAVHGRSARKELSKPPARHTMACGPAVGSLMLLNRRKERHQGFCQARKQRSGWGMSARWRPHGEVSAAMPSGEPLGLNGYASVAAPAASQYLCVQVSPLQKTMHDDGRCTAAGHSFLFVGETTCSAPAACSGAFGCCAWGVTGSQARVNRRVHFQAVSRSQDRAGAKT
jgi:hypothetical protein